LKEEYKEQIQKHELENNSSNKEIRDLKNQTDSIDKEFNIFKKHSESEIESYVNENESLRSEIVDLGHSRAKLK
jgi:cell division protein FtsB